MRSKSTHAIAAILFAGALLAGCATSTPTPAAPPSMPTESPRAFELTVLHTNDVRGYIEPCGWRPPKGGLARRATFIRQIREQSPYVLLLDAGNSLVSEQPITADTQGKVTVEGMNRLGYDAMTIGDQDFRWGSEAVRQRMAEAKFPLLSANVFAGNSQQLLAQPYVIKETSGHRVAIIGVTGKNAPSFLPPGGVPEPLLVADPVETVRRTITSLAGKATVFVVLSNLGFEQDQQLAAKVPGIALVVGGNPGTLMAEPFKDPSHGTLLVQAGYQGEWIGRLTLQIDERGKVTSYKGDAVPLGEDFADDPEMRAWLDSLKATR